MTGGAGRRPAPAQSGQLPPSSAGLLFVPAHLSRRFLPSAPRFSFFFSSPKGHHFSGGPPPYCSVCSHLRCPADGKVIIISAGIAIVACPIYSALLFPTPFPAAASGFAFPFPASSSSLPPFPVCLPSKLMEKPNRGD
jgi:hypothetical protein